jgi:hypothetical protein
MWRDTALNDHKTTPRRDSARLASVLLGVTGLALVGAGALLWARHGEAVFIDNPVLAALAWCFGTL